MQRGRGGVFRDNYFFDSLCGIGVASAPTKSRKIFETRAKYDKLSDRIFRYRWRADLRQIFLDMEMTTLSERMTIRLSAAELAHIREQAAATNQTASAYLRSLIKKDMEVQAE